MNGEQTDPQIRPDLSWAKTYVAGLNGNQVVLLKVMHEHYQKHIEAKKQMEQQQKILREAQEKAQLEQQAILDSLVRQKPVKVEVNRTSVSPVSHTSSESEGDITVKDVIIGKMKSALPHSCLYGVKSYKPYRSRGNRERFFFEGHLYIFDKYSYDCKKRFFRCERKNTCPARIHTPVDSNKVIHRVQSHNHPAPSTEDLSNYNIDFLKVKCGFLMPVTPIRMSGSNTPSSLTSPSDLDEENFLPKLGASTSPMNFLNFGQETVTGQLDGRKPVILRIPDNFHRLPEAEVREMELAITKFLMQETELRKELMAKNNELPVVFPSVSKDELVLLVANYTKDDDLFQFVQVKERTEAAIRAALQLHFKQECSRALKMSISAKINVPLTQQIVDQWKSEEFIRVDVSKPNDWKIHVLMQIE
ncbi:unnamed protein product [Caenorhabditis sp. 36 PRJEB53466]|nr:unnamed protein product [Caenorhabditis sp. 36 PRJEB53466]